MPTLDALHGSRRRYLMLAGWHAHAVQVGVARHVRDVGGILDATALVTHRPPRSWRGHGVVCMPGSDPAIHAFLATVGVPVVSIHRPLPDCPTQVCVVGQDDVAIGRAAAEHLLDQGLSAIGYCLCFGDELQHPVTIGRLQGMREALTRRGLPCHVVMRDRLAEDLAPLPRPIGLMAQNDHYAVTVLDCCLELGLSVPEDVAVIGCDNDELHCELSAIPLSSVETRCTLLGFRAAEILGRAMAGEQVPPRSMVPCGEVTVRASTTAAFISHVPTARAQRALRERYRQPIDLDQLADDVGMSRRRLEDRFHKHFGRSMADELQRIRLTVARRLLEDPSLKLREVARRSGMGNDAYFSRVFRQTMGCTPGSWRRSVTLGGMV